MNSLIKLTTFQRIVLGIGAFCLAVSIFLPIWRIDLDAPQYPEGLRLLIYPNKLGGQVDIVNGLNHYIGMKTIHKEDFIEFTVLPYIIAFFAFFTLLVAILGKRRWLSLLLMAFILFGVIAMIDFWKWEYDYGHNLNPNAAIIVPGMSYQPPLIGFKQLLNFGAYSIPDVGGWLFIAAGLMMVLAWFTSRKNMLSSTLLILPFLGLLSSCSDFKPEAIIYNVDACYSCKMTISDHRFGCELITIKGKIYKFDDPVCLANFTNEIGNKNVGKTYYTNFVEPNALTEIDSLTFIKSDLVKSPMNGNIAAFVDKDIALKYKEEWKGDLINSSNLFK